MSWFSDEREASASTGNGCRNPKCVGDNGMENGACTGCGQVIREFQASNDVQFSEAGSALGTRYEVGVQPRDRDVGNSYDRYAVGRAAIRKLMGAISCEQDDVLTKAQATYRLAVVNDFVKAGRPVNHVAAACVYVACRKSRWPVLLMDVSQILQINLFKLGRLVKKLCVALHQKLNTCPLLAAYGSDEYVDASLYVARFVRKLEFGGEDNVQRVTNLACRVLQKMQNDWIQCGRHPAGLFGASIVIAARLLGYNRTHKEVARHVFIAGVTIGKRVFEFAESTAGEMTLRDFEDKNFGASANPPAYENAKRKREEREREERANATLENALEKLKEAEAPTGDMKAWLDAGNSDTLFSAIEHEDDEPLSDSELDGYILDVTEHKDEIRVRENMYSLQYGAWEVEKAKKLAEKVREKEEKKANRKRKRLPKNIQAAKKVRSAELSTLVLNDPKTASLFEQLGKSVSVAPAEILKDTDMKEETDTKPTKVNDTKLTKFDTENNSSILNTDTTKPTKDDYDDDNMSDVTDDIDDIDYDFPERARDGANEYDDDYGGDPFDDDLGWG